MLGPKWTISNPALNVNIFGSRKWVPLEKREIAEMVLPHHSPCHGTHFSGKNGVDFPLNKILGSDRQKGRVSGGDWGFPKGSFGQNLQKNGWEQLGHFVKKLFRLTDKMSHHFLC